MPKGRWITIFCTTMVENLKSVDLGRSGLKVSELGCGGIPIMRVGQEEAKTIICRCFQLGIRFFDTAHVYGDSEEKMGLALEPVRDQVVLATKVWAKDGAGAAKELGMSFERLRTDRIDLIQCHNVSNRPDLDRVMGPGGAYEVLDRAKTEGKVRAIGLSSHNPDIAAQAVHTGKFDTLQFPFNFIEDDPQEKVFPVAREQGVGLIAMKPLGGGLLERADLCFGFLQQFPDVVPIPGIQAVKEVNEIVEYYHKRRPLGKDDRKLIRKIRNELGGRFCHRCEYCMPCEQGVQIPKVLLIKSQMRRFSPKQLVFMAKEAVVSAEQCVDCGECVEKCPYHLPIPDLLKESAQAFEKIRADHDLNPGM